MTRREHRTVTLPDYQGVGIGNALSNTIAAMWRTFGYRADFHNDAPGHDRQPSPFPLIAHDPAAVPGLWSGHIRHAVTRLTAGFEYIGPPLPRSAAVSLLAHEWTTDRRKKTTNHPARQSGCRTWFARLRS